ncbi:MAG: 1-(5-phosphoribosyl)-5-[(5-phosphoribosylamino)methylideneamino]imidazole-4-carboxamide isomerase [Synechococcaceae cyanobacterium SM2_3_2]|nr:1-(5-phosphoribosyl)-5-[(5-phosphoribosylamino)methylideneamino]imidazole-4-carboxamide isomerase [Synechococcaceae cyanobacterium SM2_3_2]
MNVIPAIDLLGGQCVRLYQGDYAQAETVGADPLTQAQQWADQGATRLHVVDLDGAKSGDPVNHAVIGQIAQQLSIPVQVGGGIRSVAGAESLLSAGVSQVIVGTLAVEEPELLAQLCQQFPGQIIVGIDARDGWVATRGWIETSRIRATDLVEQVAQLGAVSIIYTDIQRDGTLQGPNLAQLRAVAQVSGIPVIASGGIGSLTDLLSLLTLEPLGVTGVIVGKALYAGAFDLKSAHQAVGSGRWQDVMPEDGTLLA